jgi:hypothetical protein
MRLLTSEAARDYVATRYGVLRLLSVGDSVIHISNKQILVECHVGVYTQCCIPLMQMCMACLPAHCVTRTG